MKLSLIIPAKDKNDPKLADLLRSIDAQDFPKDQMEILVITEGSSESAKAIGIRRASGKIIGILASDNELTFKTFLSEMTKNFPVIDAAWPAYYSYFANDDILNRYFALIGGNDPLSFYMGKNDRKPYWDRFIEIPDFQWTGMKPFGTIGDNGFFVKKELIEDTNLENYYHIDNAIEACANKTCSPVQCDIWHKTGGNIFKFFAKRYRYGLQHAFNKNRRWHLVDFRQPKDILRFSWFIVCTLSIIQPIYVSFTGWLKIRDKAWFLHPIVCLMTLATYTILVIQLGLKKMSQLLFARTAASTA